MIRGLATL